MSSHPKPVGEELRHARVQAGLELTDVAAHLRIRSNFLSALEEGRPDALPGLTYAIGYVRTYAGFLGLDPDAAVRRFKEEAAGINAKPQLVFPSPAPEGRVPGLLLMLVAAMLAGGAFSGWYWLSERDGDLRGLVPSVPERLAQLIEGDAPPAISNSAATAPAADSVSPRTASGVAPAAGSYVDANPKSVAVPQPRTTAAAPTATATPATAPQTATAPAAPPRAAEATPAAGSPARTPATAGQSTPVPATPVPATPLSAAPTPVVQAPATPAPVAAAPSGSAPPAPAPAPAPATTASPAGIPAGPSTAAITSTAAETPADGTPDVTAPPESTAAGAPSVPGAPPIATAARSADPARDVPAAPRIAGLIGASEAAVPSGRAAGPVDRVMIRATGDSWVQVRDAQGTALFTRVLREGDIYRVPDQGGLRLATGNAGALEILVDGTPAPSLGGLGEVVRNVLLDPTRLSAGTAAGANR